MKIVFLDAATIGADISLDALEHLGAFRAYPTTSPDEVIEHIGDAQIVLCNKVVIDAGVMDACKQIRLICITATGMNNVDLEYAKSKGILIKNAVGYSSDSVAQMTFALALALLSKIAFYDHYVKSGESSKSAIFTNLDRPFHQIKGKRWGIIGLGNIGRAVAAIAVAFGAEVVYYSTSGTHDDATFARLDLEELLRSSDFISIHAPLNAQTKNLIQKNQLAQMKSGAILINVGRGGIVNEDDLASALDAQDLYAGIDVTAVEPIEPTNKLLHVRAKDRLILTPHIAWASRESREQLMQIVAGHIRKFLQESV